MEGRRKNTRCSFHCNCLILGKVARPEGFKLPAFWFVGGFCATRQPKPAYKNQQNQRENGIALGSSRLVLYPVHGQLHGQSRTCILGGPAENQRSKCHDDGLERIPQTDWWETGRVNEAKPGYSAWVPDADRRECERRPSGLQNAGADFRDGGRQYTLRWLHCCAHGCGAEGRREQGRDQRSAGRGRGDERRSGHNLLDAGARCGGREDAASTERLSHNALLSLVADRPYQPICTLAPYSADDSPLELCLDAAGDSMSRYVALDCSSSTTACDRWLLLGQLV